LAFDLKQPPRENLTSFIEQELRRALMSGRLHPGERLNIRSLARRLGTSPTPVREALFKLVAERALEGRPGHFLQVPVPTRERYLEICAIRKAVEGLATETAIQHVTDAQIARLERLNAKFQQAKIDGHYQLALEINCQFRFGIYQLARMPTLVAIIEGLWLQIGPFFNLLYPPQPTDPGHVHDYEGTLAALRDRNGPAARRAIERSIDAGTTLLMAHFDAQSADPAVKKSRSRKTTGAAPTRKSSAKLT
jgi:GntR family colanic acid and biofilm gene transcriptional regulator